MKLHIAENTDIAKVQKIVDDAIAMGWKVVHKPDSNVINLEARKEARRVMNACFSPEAAA